MNGIHDLGGMDGFARIVREDNEPVFHSEWEERTFALALSTMAARCFNTDEFRRTVERMPPVRYLGASYYERWLYSLETLLAEKGIVTRDEIEAALRDPKQSRVADAASRESTSSAGAREREKVRKARFSPGQRVVAKNINPAGHTRLPRYARGKRGIVRHDWGLFALPDSRAHGMGRNTQHCYGVEFEARELWGRDHPARERIYLDLWEDYLESDRGQPAKAETTKKVSKPLLAKPPSRTKPKTPSKMGKARTQPRRAR
jgi:nitrile hydratase beta subunit